MVVSEAEEAASEAAAVEVAGAAVEVVVAMVKSVSQCGLCRLAVGLGLLRTVGADLDAPGDACDVDEDCDGDLACKNEKCANPSNSSPGKPTTTKPGKPTTSPPGKPPGSTITTIIVTSTVYVTSPPNSTPPPNDTGSTDAPQPTGSGGATPLCGATPQACLGMCETGNSAYVKSPSAVRKF